MNQRLGQRKRDAAAKLERDESLARLLERRWPDLTPQERGAAFEEAIAAESARIKRIVERAKP